MARKKMVTSRDMRKMRVLGGKRGTKRIGKVKYCVFHPSEKRCIGFMVKRPDLLWMFHRKDLFVALDGFDLIDGRIVVKNEGEPTGPAACRRMGLDFDRCVIWDGMPLMTMDQTAIGCVGNITFSLRTGEVESVEASNGATAKYLLGTLDVPEDYIAGFKRGIGVDLAVKDDSRDTGTEEEHLKGAIIVSDDVWELSPEGGWAEAAGEFTARTRERMHEAAEKAKPKVQEVTHVAGEAINEGAYAVGKRVAESKGMFASFKEEYQKARGTYEAEELPSAEDNEAEDFENSQVASSVVPDEPQTSTHEEPVELEEYEEYDEDVEYEEEPSRKKAAAQKDKGSSVTGMFAAFKEEYNKARYED